jgi:hypothetical protein
LLLGAAAAAAAASSWPRSRTTSQSLAAATCGVERWSIKTLADRVGRRAHFTLRNSSVHALRRLPVPASLPQASRLPRVETTAYRINVLLIEARIEGDQDIHLVVADPLRPAETLIVEFPNAPSCTAGTSAARARGMRRARARFARACGRPSSSRFRRLHGQATVTGVGFFDFQHGQTGVAPNGVELHPVLGFRGRCA